MGEGEPAKATGSLAVVSGAFAFACFLRSEFIKSCRKFRANRRRDTTQMDLELNYCKKESD